MVHVNEIFLSIQGEGPHVGRPAVFVRLGGCNLRCGFCDTRSAQTQWMDVSVEQLVEAIQRYNCKYIVFTGGEPLLQLPELQIIIPALRGAGYIVAIETNGTIPLINEFDFADLIVVSPKMVEDALHWINKSNVVLKFVATEDTLGRILEYCRDHHISGAYIMPEGTDPSVLFMRSALITERILNSGLDLYVGLRNHIIMGLR